MIRVVMQRIFREGRLLIVSKRRIHSKIVDHSKRRKRATQEQKEWQVAEYKSGPLWRVGNQARRLFVDNFNAAHRSPAVDENIKRIFYNNRIPFFAFVGVSLASGSVAIITKDDELEGMCWEIRETVAKMHQSREDLPSKFESLRLEDLEIGPNIGKGCSAVVYAAALKETKSRDDFAVHMKRFKSIDEYPLALKMMFNYDIQSNALMILKAMYRETVPARQSSLIDPSAVNVPYAAGGPSSSVNLPPHANIVMMFNAFCDQIPDIADGTDLYPSALPSRLYADGYGRNMSMFLVMKRYNFNLERYLQRPEMKSRPRMALLLFAQLLEAVAHMYRHGVAHRDLKSDNILIEKHENCSVPLLVITDFGCCLADRMNGFILPYPSEDMDKGGNAALMAPEIITKRPGPFAVLDYSKSDLWAAGAIGYEIFGERNPFLDTKAEKSELRNYDYEEVQLPKMGENCPPLVQNLIANLLKRNPKKRLTPDVAANVMQLFLWAPAIWLNPMERLPTSDEILDWLFCMTTKVLCENIFTGGSERRIKKDSYTEYLLISSFLQRASLSRIKQALIWIRTTNKQTSL